MLDSLFVKVSCKLNSGRLIAPKFGFPNEGHFEQWADTDSKRHRMKTGLFHLRKENSTSCFKLFVQKVLSKKIEGKIQLDSYEIQS
jgi:hypothetical protein